MTRPPELVREILGIAERVLREQASPLKVCSTPSDGLRQLWCASAALVLWRGPL
jgi:hypothetical protein